MDHRIGSTQTQLQTSCHPLFICGHPAENLQLIRIVDGVANEGEIDFTTYDWLHYCKDGDLELDCPLLRLAHKVTRMPQGNGKGILTIAIENAKAKNHWSVMLSELATYVAQEGLIVPEFRLLTSNGTLSVIAIIDRAARDAFRITYKNLT